MRGRARKGQNPLTRVYESNGPDVKVRGTANHVAEKYLQLARDSQSSGDPVAAENYYQHAEHYFRLIAAVQEQFRQTQPFGSDGQGSYEGDEDEIEPGMGGEPFAPREQSQPYPQQQQREQQPYQQREQREQQPYQPREQREQQPYQPREQRFDRNRDRDNRGEQRNDRGDRTGNDRSGNDRSGNDRNAGDRSDRGDRPERGDRDGNYQPRQQPQAQPQPQQSEPDEAPDVDRLPAFVTGGVTTQPPAANNGHTGGQNGLEGGADRFPLHRRRRRRGPRDGAAPAGETTEAAGPVD